MNRFNQTLILFILSYFVTLFIISQFVVIEENLSPPNSLRITGLIIEFENFKNDLHETVRNVCKVIPQLIVYSETFLYPPIDLSLDNCQITFLELEKSIYKSHEQKNLQNLLQNTDYLFIIPDSTRIHSIRLVESILQRFHIESNLDALLIPLQNQTVKCDNQFHFDVKRWTLKYSNWSLPSTSLQNCNYLSENKSFAVFIKKHSLFKLPFPLLRPFSQSFLIQSQISRLNLELFPGDESLLSLSDANQFQNNQHYKEKYDYLQAQRTYSMYHKLGIKQIIHSDESIESFGCNRQMPRCFGTIIDDTPDYMIKGRWLPPCCRRNLETTGRYVFSLLDRLQIRYWLEGGSLLGAVRNGKIIDWDYDIDIGIYQQDMHKFPTLQNLFQQQKPGLHFEDGQGYIWERAIEGEFIKVHYSRTNRIHVDIFPFVSINGTMTKNTWFKDHPQDMPFPEHFLLPLTKMQFIGMNVSAPNNVRQFLEMKFGRNCIEQPKYPSSSSSSINIELEFINEIT